MNNEETQYVLENSSPMEFVTKINDITIKISRYDNHGYLVKSGWIVIVCREYCLYVNEVGQGEWTYKKPSIFKTPYEALATIKQYPPNNKYWKDKN